MILETVPIRFIFSGIAVPKSSVDSERFRMIPKSHTHTHINWLKLIQDLLSFSQCLLDLGAGRHAISGKLCWLWNTLRKASFTVHSSWSNGKHYGPGTRDNFPAPSIWCNVFVSQSFPSRIHWVSGSYEVFWKMDFAAVDFRYFVLPTSISDFISYDLWNV